MSVYGIIAEFNPFHNGHELLINKIKKKDSDAIIVAVMSGSFVERGDICVVDKYSRATAAIEGGCNLVLELPAPWSFSGAELFARGGVQIADKFGGIDFLAFGSETGDVEALSLCANRLKGAEFSKKAELLRSGNPELNLAEIRKNAYTELYGESKHFSGSNDLLALEYISAINELDSNIEPVAFKREGGDYNSKELSKICSATAIRNGIESGEDLSAFMPKKSLELLKNELQEGRIYRLSGLDTAAVALLRRSDAKELSEIMEISGGMENRLIRAADSSRTISEIISLAKQRRYSESRIRRAIIAALIGVKMSDVRELPLFTVLLAADFKGRELLSKARKNSKIAIVSKPSDEKTLPTDAAKQYYLHKKAERIGELCCESQPRRISAVMV